MAGARASPLNTRQALRELLEARRDKLEALLLEARDDLAALVDAIVAGSAIEHDGDLRHDGERRQVERSADERRAALVRRALDGDEEAITEVRYEVRDRVHLAVIAGEAGARDALARLAADLGLSLLAVRASAGELWAWLGAPRRMPTAAVEDGLLADGAPSATYALGAQGRGIEGWRQSHAQAQAAWRLARRKPRRLTSYGSNPLLATALSDEPLCAWLRELVAPLAGRNGRRVALEDALRAYLEAGQNASSAAASLGIGRHTLERYLADAETLIGRPLRACASEVQIALQLGALTS